VEVQKQLAAKEEQDLLQGCVMMHATSPSAFIVMGMELEEIQ